MGQMPGMQPGMQSGMQPGMPQPMQPIQQQPNMPTAMPGMQAMPGMGQMPGMPSMQGMPNLAPMQPMVPIPQAPTQPMQPMQPVNPMMAMPMQPMMAAPMANPVAAPTPAQTGPVLGLAQREQYLFAEASIPRTAQLSLLAEPAVSEGLCLWVPSKFDPELRALKHLFERQLEDKLSELPYSSQGPTHWFRFSPFELFMEHVLAKNLWKLE